MKRKYKKRATRLDDDTISRFMDLVQRGQSVSTATKAIGSSRSGLYVWMKQGEANPDSVFGQLWNCYSTYREQHPSPHAKKRCNKGEEE